MKKIKTLALCVDSADRCYDMFREERVLREGEYKNELGCYELDGNNPAVKREKYNFPSLDDRELDERIAPRRSVKAIIQFDPSMIIAGQTKIAENFVIELKKEGILIVRFSSFYPQKKGYSYKITGGGIERGEMYAVSVEEAGYALDCPKDIALIQNFLQDQGFLEGVFRKDKNLLEKAVDRLNQGREIRIMKTGFFERLWR